MVTDFGKLLRKERIELGWTMQDMVDQLNNSCNFKITAAYLSHMEMGRRPVPNEVTIQIAKLLKYDDIKAQKLRNLAAQAYKPKIIKIGTENLEDDDRDMALLFARRFEDLTEESKNEIKKLLQGYQGEDDGEHRS